MNQIGIVKTHFNFGGMDVYIVLVAGHFNKQKDNRVSVRFEGRSIRLLDCVGDKFISNESAVKKYILELVIRPRYARFAHQSENVQCFFVAFSFNQVLGNFGREQFSYSAGKAFIGKKAINLSAVMYQRKSQIAICQSDASEICGDVSHFGVGGSEELSSCGQFVEKVSDLYCSAVIGAAGGYVGFSSTVNLDTVAAG